VSNSVNTRGNCRYGALSALGGCRVNHIGSQFCTCGVMSAHRSCAPSCGCIRPNLVMPEVRPERCEGKKHDRCCICSCCRPRPEPRARASADDPDRRTCAGWPLYYTGNCGPTQAEAGCHGVCACPMHVEASAKFTAFAPLKVQENGHVDFDFEYGDVEWFREENGRVRVTVPGRYLVTYTIQIPRNEDVCTRLALTLDGARILSSQVEIEGCAPHSRTYTGNALIDVSRGQRIALQATNAFAICDRSDDAPAVTLTIVRVG
jgi:hypothetical protein